MGDRGDYLRGIATSKANATQSLQVSAGVVIRLMSRMKKCSGLDVLVEEAARLGLRGLGWLVVIGPIVVAID